MSAFMVDDAHIDVLIDVAKQYGRRNPYLGTFYWYHDNKPHYLPDQDPSTSETTIGRMLLAENARSVGGRYREVQNPAALTYTYRPTRRQFTHAEALQALRCYEYQSCECDDWKNTEAHAFVEYLTARIVRIAVPIPDATPWGWTDAHLGRTPAIAGE